MAPPPDIHEPEADAKFVKGVGKFLSPPKSLTSASRTNPAGEDDEGDSDVQDEIRAVHNETLPANTTVALSKGQPMTGCPLSSLTLHPRFLFLSISLAPLVIRTQVQIPG